MSILCFVALRGARKRAANQLEQLKRNFDEERKRRAACYRAGMPDNAEFTCVLESARASMEELQSQWQELLEQLGCKRLWQIDVNDIVALARIEMKAKRCLDDLFRAGNWCRRNCCLPGAKTLDCQSYFS
jgi:hypothetical protein